MSEILYEQPLEYRAHTGWVKRWRTSSGGLRDAPLRQWCCRMGMIGMGCPLWYSWWGNAGMKPVCSELHRR
jgi:hypothetical protein